MSKSSAPSSPHVQVGRPNYGIYSAKIESRINQGFTIYDNVDHVQLGLTPEFTSSTGKLSNGHFIFPLDKSGVQAVYTPQATQLAEDLVLNHPVSSVAFGYGLRLGTGMSAQEESNGAVAVYKANKLLFQLATPIVLESNGKQGGKEVPGAASVQLSGNTLDVVASGLTPLHYPVVIDPSVIVTGANDFLLGNNEGGVNVSSGSVTEAGLTGGSLSGGWSSTTALPQTLYTASSVVCNGYVYELGGTNGSAYQSTVYYAPINSNGTLGAWTSTTALPQALELATSVAYNGYVYELGGDNSSSAYQSTVYYAPINSNGTLGSWTSTSALPQTLDGAASVVYNGYVYELGGENSSIQSTVYYAPINSNGTLGAWTSTTALPQTLVGATSVAYNGYAYELGGGNGNAYQSTVYYASINSNGTLGSWTSTTALPQALVYASPVAYNGYVYEIDGYASGGAVQSTVYYAPLNANGTVGYWSSTTALPQGLVYASSIVYDGYAYELGGDNGSSVQSTVYYAKIDPAGVVGSWPTTTSLSQALRLPASATYNGYIYLLRGYDDGGSGVQLTVYYAPINSNGTLGSWGTTTALPTAEYGLSAAAYNGYLYELGGTSANTVNYAPINSNGTIGSWTSTTSLPPSGDFAFAGAVAYNGYIYELGGDDSGTLYSTVYYAPINSNGTLGSWGTTTALSQSLDLVTTVAASGYLYELAGNTGSSFVSTVNYAPINSNGTIGSWTTTTSLPQGLYESTAVVYNGFIYEIGGGNSSVPSTVYYAPINSNGALGLWNTTTALPTAEEQGTALAYNGYLYYLGGTSTGSSAQSTVYYAQVNNGGPGTTTSWSSGPSLATAVYSPATVAYAGYLYELGGVTSSSVTATVSYASIGANGALGSWNSATSLPQALGKETAVAYSSYLYVIGGDDGSGAVTTVYYAPINSNGTLGSWNTTTALPQAVGWGEAAAYNGYLYSLGGQVSGSFIANTYYAPINSNGTIGAWTATTSLPVPVAKTSTVTYDAFIYTIAGYGLSAIYYAPINSNGTIGQWSQSPNSLAQATEDSVAAADNGYVYDLGGYTSGPVSTVYYAGLQSIPRVGQYSTPVNLGQGVNVTPDVIVTSGTNAGNPGIGGLANGAYSALGGITIQYENGTTSCAALSPQATVASGAQQLATAYQLTFTTDGCGNSTNQGEYAWVHFTLDDSQTATFPDVNSNHTSISGFQIYYHAATSMRLRGGATFSGGSLQALDTPPTPGSD